MWGNFIYYVLDKLQYNKNKEKTYFKTYKYYQISNPFIKDLNPSCSVYIKSGLMRLYNSDINGKDTLEIYEWTRLLGFYKEYVNYLCQFYEMTLNEFLQNKTLIDRYHIDKTIEYEDIKFHVKQNNTKFKSSTECEEVKISDFEYEKVKEYIESMNLEIKDGLRPCRLRIYNKDDNYESFRTVVAFDYKNSKFKKYRYISNDNKYRYRANGMYDTFYTARNNNSLSCYIVEGEKESIIVSKYVTDDVYGLSGTSIPNSDMLKNYIKITVLIDYDKYKERLSYIKKTLRALYPDVKIIVRPKILTIFNNKFDTTLDYSDLHSDGTLNTDIILNGRFQVSDIKPHLQHKFKLLI